MVVLRKPRERATAKTQGSGGKYGAGLWAWELLRSQDHNRILTKTTTGFWHPTQDWICSHYKYSHNMPCFSFLAFMSLWLCIWLLINYMSNICSSTKPYVPWRQKLWLLYLLWLPSIKHGPWQELTLRKRLWNEWMSWFSMVPLSLTSSMEPCGMHGRSKSGNSIYPGVRSLCPHQASGLGCQVHHCELGEHLTSESHEELSEWVCLWRFHKGLDMRGPGTLQSKKGAVDPPVETGPGCDLCL